MTKRLMMGNEAFAFAALEAGVRVVAGYPGTPSSELIETVAHEKAEGRAEGVHVEWSANEKVALELLASASYSGARCLFTCKQVGLNVASDALMSLNYVGVKGGLVLFVADDPGPISSQTEQDTRRFAQFAKVPVLDPCTPEQGYDMIKAAFELSEKYLTPVIVRATTRVCHASTFIEVPEQTSPKVVPGFEKDSRWVIFPKRSYEAHGEINERLRDIQSDFSLKEPYKNFNSSHTFTSLQSGHPDQDTTARKGIVAGGISVGYVQEACTLIRKIADDHSIAVPTFSLMQVGTPYPFPSRAIAAYSEWVEEILVFEELDSVIEDSLYELIGKQTISAQIFGKATGTTQDRGENTIYKTAETIALFLGLEEIVGTELSILERGIYGDAESAPDLPPRPPVLCAGCPHRKSFYTIKRALKDMKQPGILSGDIGCYTLGNALPLDMVDTCLCMGAGISMAQGFSLVEPNKKNVAFIGDSTFFASGLSSIANAVYNQHDICIVVLDNSTTAMTGSQPHPGTGQTLMGTTSTPIDIEQVLRALGISHIGFADSNNFESSKKVAIDALKFEGPSAIIFKEPCVGLIAPKEIAEVDSSACIMCRKCITEIGCPALRTSADETEMVIDTSLCIGCALCVEICPTKALQVGVRQ